MKKHLLKKRYVEFDACSFVSNKKEKYLIKQRFNETPQHCFLVYDIVDFLSRFKNIKNIQTPETKKPDVIAWRKIAGTRDMVIHSYFNVDLDIVWWIIKKELPSLKKNILKIRNSLCLTTH